MKDWKKYLAYLVLILTSFFTYYYLDRTDHLDLALSFILLFASYFMTLKWESNWRIAIRIGILIRLMSILAMPNLSDDFYRFYWDGMIQNNGYDVFEHKPIDLYESEKFAELGIDEEVYQNLNSKEYYSIYPPINQSIFRFVSSITNGDLQAFVSILKLLIFLVEIVTALFFILLLKRLNLSLKYAIIYFLNPLVFIEFTGNLHFEAWMVLGLLGAFFFLLKEKLIPSVLFFALAVCSKLIPLMFLPVLFFKLGWKKGSLYALSVMALTVLFFIPYISIDQIPHFLESVQLYFKTFEFNASIFYVIKSIGMVTVGYDLIQTVGPILSVLTLLMILFLSIYKVTIHTAWNKVFERMALSLLIYLLLSNIIHPWYILPLFALSILSNKNYGMFWTILIPISYFAYHVDGVEEKWYLILIEYALLFQFIYIEYFKPNLGRKLSNDNQ